MHTNDANEQTVRNIFITIRLKHGDKFLEEATKELQDELYDGLEIELAEVALTLPWFAPLVRDRKAAPPAAPTTAPTTAQKSNAPAPDKDQAPKPQGEDEKK